MAFYNSFFQTNEDDSSDAVSTEHMEQVPVLSPLGLCILIGILFLSSILFIGRKR